MSDQLPDWEWSFREWLRTTFPDDKIWFDPPRGTPVVPMITIGGQIGGLPDSYLPLDAPRTSLSVWGPPGGDGRQAAVDLKNELVAELEALAGPLDGDTYAYGAIVTQVLWFPDRSDPNNVIPRYIVDLTLSVRAS
jgi:hypothetical protein